MGLVRRITWVLCLILFSTRVQAQSLPLQNLDEEDLKKVVSDMSANFLHTSVSGASTLGRIWGFEIGLIGGQASTPHLNEVVNQSDPNAQVTKLPHGALLGVLTVPIGLTAELGMIPKVGSKDFKFNTTSLALKWTANEITLPGLPVSLAAKLAFTKTAVAFTQTVSPSTTPTDFKFETNQAMFSIFVSKDLAILEPYAAIGVAQTKGDLSASGGTIQLFSVPDMSGSVSRSSPVYIVGTELKLLAFKLGAEYTSVFGTSRYSGKLSLYF